MKSKKSESFEEFAAKKSTPGEKGRNKVESNVRHDVLLKAEQIFDTFKKYSDGVRVMFLIHRNKEGGETNNTKVRKIITKNKEEFRLELIKLVDEKERSKVPYRIYSAVNERNIKKAIRKFKFEQLEADYYDEEQSQQFYYDIKNRFIGCLMQPGSAGDSKFLFDCDSTDAWNGCIQQLGVLGIEIFDQYPTKNGWHVITPPFNPNLFNPIPDVGINKDGLVLLAY